MCAITAPPIRLKMWPASSLAEWRTRMRRLHMWSQVVGKMRFGAESGVNHWWKFRSMSAAGSYHVSDSLRKGKTLKYSSTSSTTRSTS